MYLRIITLVIICAMFLNFRQNAFNRLIQRWRACCAEYTNSLNCLNYRSDCSGFVSYMWGVPTQDGGARTFGVGNANIRYWGCPFNDRRQLIRGDAILVPNVHIVLFDAWCDEYRHCTVYEMCNVGNCRGFKHHVVLFPFEKKGRRNFTDKDIILLKKR